MSPGTWLAKAGVTGLWFVHDPVTAPMGVLRPESLFQMAVGQLS